MIGPLARWLRLVSVVLRRAVARVGSKLGIPDLSHIPGPRGLAFFSMLLHFRRDSIGALDETRRRHGSIASYPWPISTVIVYDAGAIKKVLSDKQRNYFARGAQPEELRIVMGEGLSTNNDRASWARSRAIVNPAMSARSVRSYAPVFAARTEAMLDAWSSRGEQSVVDVSVEMRRLAFAIAAETLLGAELREEDARTVDEAVRSATHTMHRRMFSALRWPYWLPTPANRALLRHRAQLWRVIDRAIAQARASAPTDGEGATIVQRLAHARDPETGEALDDAMLRDEALTLLIAGYETTASTLMWTLGGIALDPSLQASLCSEIDEAGVDIDSLSFRETHPRTYRVLLESLRLYSAFSMTSRRAAKDDELCGHRIPAGTSVVIPVLPLHRDAALWSEPLAFSPDRFRGCPAHQVEHFVPFSKGERSCIGQTFAMVELAIIVTRVLRAFSLSSPSGALPRPVSEVTLSPEGGLSLRMRRREASGSAAAPKAGAA